MRGNPLQEGLHSLDNSEAGERSENEYGLMTPFSLLFSQAATQTVPGDFQLPTWSQGFLSDAMASIPLARKLHKVGDKI